MRSLIICRLAARVAGLMLILLIATFAAGEGAPNPFDQPADVQVEFLALSMVIAGIIAGWWHELGGGLISLAGCGLFIGTEISRHGWPKGGVILLAIPGALNIASGWLRHRARIHSRTSRSAL